MTSGWSESKDGFFSLASQAIRAVYYGLLGFLYNVRSQSELERGYRSNGA